MSDLVQMNLSVSPDLVESVERLAEENDWSKRHTVELAVRAFKVLMESHEAFADQLEGDIGELYLRLAREAPEQFVEVPKEGVKVGRAAGQPAVLVDNWLIFPDETGGLLAEEQGGRGRVGPIVDGEIKPLKLPTPEEVVLN